MRAVTLTSWGMASSYRAATRLCSEDSSVIVDSSSSPQHYIIHFLKYSSSCNVAKVMNGHEIHSLKNLDCQMICS